RHDAFLDRREWALARAGGLEHDSGSNLRHAHPGRSSRLRAHLMSVQGGGPSRRVSLALATLAFFAAACVPGAAAGPVTGAATVGEPPRPGLGASVAPAPDLRAPARA